MHPIEILMATAAVTAQPIGDPQSWITADDYPKSALEASGEGSVRVILLVDVAGHAEDCTVQKSSGNSELDILTCNLLRQRAKFSPARDAAGNAKPSKRMQKVHWEIAREQLISQGARMTYDLGSTGKISGCDIKEFGIPDPDLTCNPQMVAELTQKFLKYPLTHYSSVSILLAMQVNEDTTIGILRPDGEERIIISKARIGVSQSGIITTCSPDQGALYDGRTLDLCRGTVRVGQKEFERDPSGKARILTVSFEIAGKPR